jgi:ABC-type nitrate/sulfonate/bicarbonate transport system permease component
MKRGGARAMGPLLSLLIVLAVLGVWALATSSVAGAHRLEAWLLPSPADVVAAFAQPDTRALILDNVGPTVAAALTGLVLCLLVGTALAVGMAASPALRDGLYPLLIASQAVPTIALAAVLVVAFGYGLTPKVVVVVLFSFFAVTVNVYDSLIAVDPLVLDVQRTLGASPWQLLCVVRLPAALPGFFTGARLASTYCISAAVYGEWVGATGGLGYALLQAANQFAQARVFAIVLVMALLGLSGFGAVTLLERLVVRWPRGEHS